MSIVEHHNDEMFSGTKEVAENLKIEVSKFSEIGRAHV